MNQGFGAAIFSILPRVSIVVPFFGLPVLWLGSHNRVFCQPKKGTTMETLGKFGF